MPEFVARIPQVSEPRIQEPPSWDEIKSSEEYGSLSYPDKLKLAQSWGNDLKAYSSGMPDFTQDDSDKIDQFVATQAVDMPSEVKQAAFASGLVKSSAGAMGGLIGAGVGALTGPAAPIAVPGLGVGGAIAGRKIAEKALETLTPGVVRAEQFAPGAYRAGQIIPEVATMGAAGGGLVKKGYDIFKELGAKRAAEELGKQMAIGAGVGAGVGTIVRGVTGQEITPGGIAYDAVIGALYTGLEGGKRVKGYTREEALNLNERVQAGKATESEFRDWKGILSEAEKTKAVGVTGAKRTEIISGGKPIFEKTTLEGTPTTIKPYFEPIQGPVSREIQVSGMRPEQPEMKRAMPAQYEQLPEVGVRGAVRGTQADTAEMQRRGIITPMQESLLNLDEKAPTGKIFSIESQGINKEAIAPMPSTIIPPAQPGPMEGELVREGAIITPRTQLPTTQRPALPEKAEVVPIKKQAAPAPAISGQIQENIGNINWSAMGIGGVPNQVDIDYFGFTIPMNYSDFRSLAAKGNWDKKTIPYIENAIKEGKEIAPPFLEVKWNEKTKVWKVSSHEGRSRSDAANNLFPNSKIPVNIFPSGMRSRDITPEMRSAPFVSESGEKIIIPGRVAGQKIPRPMAGGQAGFITSDILEKPRKLAQNYMTTNGALPKEMFDILEGLKTNRESMYASVRFALRDAKNAIYKLNNKKVTTPEQSKNILDYLNGDIKEDQLNEAYRPQIKTLRDQLDTLSRKIMSEEGLLSEKTKGIFESNIGSYLNRSYEKFDNKDFDLATLKFRDPAAFQRSADYVRRQILEEAKAEVVDYNDRYQKWIDSGKQGKTPAPPIEYLRKINETGVVPSEVLNGELERIVQQGSAKSGEAAPFQAESYGLSKRLGITKQRKEIPEEIRYLMGEYTDPLVRYTKSAMKMINLLTAHRTMVKLKEAGFNLEMFYDHPVEGTIQFASEGSQVLSPLNGVYMSQDVADAIKMIDGRNFNGAVYRTFAKLNAFYKWSKTVGSYKGQIRNFIFNIPIEIQNGNFTLLEAGKSTKAIMADVGIPRADTPEMRAYLKRAMALGVYNNAKFDELNALIREAQGDSGTFDTFIDRATANLDKQIKGIPSIATNTARDIINFANFTYRSGDNFYKLTAWENEIKQLMDGKGLSRQDAEIEAAERVSNTRPTYERLPRLLKLYKISPFGKNFISWPAERVRNSYWSLKYAIEDINTPGMRKYGWKRLIGMLVAGGLAEAGIEYELRKIGKTREDMRQLKQFVPQYQKSSSLLPVSYDEKTHNLQYIDLSFSNPFDFIWHPINAYMFKSNEGVDKALMNAVWQFGSDYLGISVPVSIAIGILSNKRTNGQPITNPQASLTRQLIDYSEYFGRSIEPSTITDLRNLYYAIKGEPDPYMGRYGRIPTVTENLSSYAGLRLQTMNLDQAIKFRASKFNNDLTQATSLFTSEYTLPGSADRSRIEAGTKEMVASRNKLFNEMHDAYLGALKWGLSSTDAIRAMADGGMSRQNIMAVVSGNPQPFTPSRMMQREMMKTSPSEFLRRQEMAAELLKENQ